MLRIARLLNHHLFVAKNSLEPEKPLLIKRVNGGLPAPCRFPPRFDIKLSWSFLVVAVKFLSLTSIIDPAINAYLKQRIMLTARIWKLLYSYSVGTTYTSSQAYVQIASKHPNMFSDSYWISINFQVNLSSQIMTDVPTGCVGKLFQNALSKNEHNDE